MTRRHARSTVIVYAAVYRCRGRPFHCRRIQRSKMIFGKRRRVMARDATNSLRIDMEIVLTGPSAVVLGVPRGRTHDMTRLTLGVHIDRAGEPIGRRLAAVAADIRTRAVRIIHGRSASCAVYAAQ